MRPTRRVFTRTASGRSGALTGTQHLGRPRFVGQELLHHAAPRRILERLDQPHPLGGSAEQEAPVRDVRG
eukprot:7046311-Prymnesium_polylepis.1